MPGHRSDDFDRSFQDNEEPSVLLSDLEQYFTGPHAASFTDA